LHFIFAIRRNNDIRVRVRVRVRVRITIRVRVRVRVRVKGSACLRVTFGVRVRDWD
jgi:hypothetical protein